MADIRAEMDLLIKKLKMLKTRVEEKITHLPNGEDVVTNSRAPRDMFAELEEYQFHVKCIEEKMKSLRESTNMCAQDVMEYLILDVELEKAKEKASDHEKIVRWLVDTQ